MLTFLPLEQIDEMDSWQGEQLNKAKEILAYELTALVHGEEEAAKAQETAKSLFSGGANNANMPTTTLTDADFTDDSINIMDLLVKAGLTPSKGEARRLVQQGGISVDDAKITDFAHNIAKDAVANGIIVKKGKKVFHKITL